MTKYPAWKTIVLIVAVLLGSLYAAPNLFPPDPAVQIALKSGEALPPDFDATVSKALATVALTPKSSGIENGKWVVRFDGTDAQLKGDAALERELGPTYVQALEFSSKTPAILTAVGARPMALGLDLRGGVHFLLQVDVDDARQAAVKRYSTDVPSFLRKQDIRYTARRTQADAVVLEFADADKLAAARTAIGKEFSDLALTVPSTATVPTIEARITDKALKDIADRAIEQNLLTLRNRVNQFGVAEPLVQRQGSDRIVVELPGVQDTTRVKELLGAIATLEYRAVDETPGAADSAARTGLVPPGDELMYMRDTHQPVLLKEDVLATGAQITDVAPTRDTQSGTPSVSVTLDGPAGDKMREFTTKNIGKPMAVLYRETEIVTTHNARGEALRERHDIADVINVANIRDSFGRQFQTTGLQPEEAKKLSDLLKGGALAATVEIVEERTVGPSLGADNIKRGEYAAVAGFLLVVTFMAIYYSVFGLFADVALLLNVILIVGLLSLFHATLTMPGIAGIVLTLGMAVDANVLINERIREELRGGLTPLRAMEAGYARAFLTIADSNITTLIAALVLYFFGNGPIKGFAITLAIGIGSSMFTAIVGTRTLAHYVFGRRTTLKDLPV